jgi:tetratricopeptide (TPR) repeat protein/predicted Ser/Thr protein kinase
MEPERWRQISRLYHAAAAQAADDRRLFLDEACRGNQTLRKEVESLLEHESAAEAFFAQPPDEVMAPRLVSDSHAPAAALQPGGTLGRYQIERQLGQGGMGRVFLAYDPTLRRKVAIKVLKWSATGEGSRSRLLHEARCVARLNHPNVCGIYEVGEESGLAFIAMEYVEGRPLADIVVDGPLPIEDTLRYGIEAAAALAHAHELGIVHRDVKAANAIISSGGRLKIVDFGLARRTGSATSDATTAATIAGPGLTVGTPYAMAPEQVRGGEAEPRTDVWALGVLLYEMVAGAKPFDAPTLNELFSSILRDPPVSLPPGTPDAIAQVVHKCLAKAPAQRYQRASDVRLVLETVASTIKTAPAAARLERRPPGADSARGGTVTVARRLTERLRSSRGIVWSAAALAVSAAIGLMVFREPVPALSERDTILLADVENDTGDPVFDGALKRALAVKLDESPFLNIFPDDRVRYTLRLMGRPPDERLTPEIGREICERQGIAAMVAGSITALGSRYVIVLTAVGGLTGDSLASVQTEADRKEDVLRALGTAASTLRRRLGESLASIERFDAPLQDATTGSLEALKAYSTGFSLASAGNSREAVALLNRAVELDPDFALAYLALSVRHLGLREPALVARHAVQAYERSTRVTERERLQIAAHYHYYVTGDLLKVLESLTQLRQTYPRDFFVFMQLGVYYTRLGQWERAAEAFGEAMRLNPDYSNAYTNLAESYIDQDRLVDAAQVLNGAVARQFEGTRLHELRFRIADLQGDAAQMQQELEWLDARDPAAGLGIRAEQAARAGRLREARAFAAKSADASVRGGQPEAGAFRWLMLAETEAASGAFGDARRDAGAALQLSTERDVMRRAARILAMSGASEDARSMLARLLEEYPPTHTFAHAAYLPSIRAALALAERDAETAIAELEGAGPYDATDYGLVYLRASAYLAGNRPSDAAAEFQKLLDQAHGSTPLSSVAQIGRARALGRSGDLAGSRRAYEAGIAAWKDSDADVPLHDAAALEFARLK